VYGQRTTASRRSCSPIPDRASQPSAAIIDRNRATLDSTECAQRPNVPNLQVHEAGEHGANDSARPRRAPDRALDHIGERLGRTRLASKDLRGRGGVLVVWYLGDRTIASAATPLSSPLLQWRRRKTRQRSCSSHDSYATLPLV
jgi:hypothetical protein